MVRAVRCCAVHIYSRRSMPCRQDCTVRRLFVRALAGPAVTYQPRWDTFGRFIQPLASRVPLMTTSGNRAPANITSSPDRPGCAARFLCWRRNKMQMLLKCADEIETQSDGTTFAAYTTRYPVPHKSSGSSSHLWYRCGAPPANTLLKSTVLPSRGVLLPVLASV